MKITRYTIHIGGNRTPNIIASNNVSSLIYFHTTPNMKNVKSVINSNY